MAKEQLPSPKPKVEINPDGTTKGTLEIPEGTPCHWTALTKKQDSFGMYQNPH